jgi:hypothetical protein
LIKRAWVTDYGSLSGLKAILQDQFDHTVIVDRLDPHLDWYKEGEKREKRGIAKVVVLPRLGCSQKVTNYDSTDYS